MAIKFYLPAGHLEESVIELFSGAGFKIQKTERGYTPKIDDSEILLKKIRPQDSPFVTALGKGDMAITGSDLVEEFNLKYPELKNDIIVLLTLSLRNTKLVAAISDSIKGIKKIEDFVEYSKKQKKEDRPVIVATEFPAIAERYLKEKGIDAIIRKPEGKTEAWILPPNPEADMIIDLTETGTTLQENNCIILDTVFEQRVVVIANKDSLKNGAKKKKIEEVALLLKGAYDARGRVSVWMNVLKKENIDTVLEILRPYNKTPTVTPIKSGGYDVFLVVNSRDLRKIIPDLKREGASSIITNNVQMEIQ